MSLTRALKHSDPRPFGKDRPVVAREFAALVDGAEAPLRMAERLRHPLIALSIAEDFLAKAGATLPTPWATKDTSAAGSPTIDYVNDATGGQFQLKHDTQDESQILTLYFGDQNVLDIDKNPWMFARVKVDAAAIPWTADQRFVVGLCGDRNDTLDSVALHAWFRMEGASANLLWETDDGTTDDDDNDTGIDVADDTWLDLAIIVEGTAVYFYGRSGTAAFALLGTGAIAAASGNVQPIVEIQKDGGAEAEDLRIDFIAVGCNR